MIDIVATEWVKLRTARSTWIAMAALGALTALMLVLAWYFVSTWDTLSPEARTHATLGSLPDLLGWIAALVMAVFGARSITSEYASEMIRATLVAMPRRPAVLAAKAIVVSATTFVVSGAAVVVAMAGTAAIVGDRPIGNQPALDADGARLVLAYALSTATFALIGLSLGALTRSGIAAIVVLALLWYVAPLVAGHLPPPWSLWLSALVPGALAGELAGTGNANSVFGAALSPVQSVVVMLSYALGPLAAASFAVDRRDA